MTNTGRNFYKERFQDIKPNKLVIWRDQKCKVKTLGFWAKGLWTESCQNPHRFRYMPLPFLYFSQFYIFQNTRNTNHFNTVLLSTTNIWNYSSSFIYQFQKQNMTTGDKWKEYRIYEKPIYRPCLKPGLRWRQSRHGNHSIVMCHIWCCYDNCISHP
jgi:hypothetical protein